MKTIILDTSFILNAIAAKIDFIRELERICLFPYRIAIIDKTLDELDTDINRGGKNKINAQLAKTIITTKNIHVIHTDKQGHVDKLILQNTTPDTAVATMDKELKTKLKRKNVPIIIIRQRKYVIFSGT